jgi:hypothetical protein
MYRDLQIPLEVPHPDNNTPLDLSSPFEVIVYIVIPYIIDSDVLFSSEEENA